LFSKKEGEEMKVLILLLSVLCWMLIAVAVVRADVEIEAISVKSDYQYKDADITMSISQQKSIFRRAIKRLRAKRIPVKAGRFNIINDPFPNLRPTSDLNVIYNEFSAYYYYLIERGLRKSGTVTHIIAPPHIVDQSKYIGGVALVCSVKNGGVSYSNASQWSSYGFTRYPHSHNALLHEVMHALGADHINAVNVMHENASQLVEDKIDAGLFKNYPDDAVLPILKESLVQINKCLKQ
jgi:hypothetical protein